jgi:hypothetical protein
MFFFLDVESKSAVARNRAISFWKSEIDTVLMQQNISRGGQVGDVEICNLQPVATPQTERAA